MKQSIYKYEHVLGALADCSVVPPRNDGLYLLLRKVIQV
ncbi:MAG: hypothetical protein JWQ96_866 [Segetibacter sp.]|nr:hypothetical protein [Segetibacter sp.]